jgi:hypothetical protein
MVFVVHGEVAIPLHAAKQASLAQNAQGLFSLCLFRGLVQSRGEEVGDHFRQGAIYAPLQADKLVAMLRV